MNRNNVKKKGRNQEFLPGADHCDKNSPIKIYITIFPGAQAPRLHAGYGFVKKDFI